MYCGHKLREEDPKNEFRTQLFTPTFSDSDEDDHTSASEPAPQIIGGYRLLRLIGSGGMGVVYEAEAPVTNSRVAVKLLSSKLASNPNSVERFKQEGLLASQLAHPCCVFVISADADAGRPYIVMELMPGETLKDVVDRAGPLPQDQAITYILDVIDGLTEAHRVGMIHRDMKPSNCFLTADGRVKVGDFGLSKSLVGSRDPHLTRSGTFLGTVLFASPEQIRGEPLDYSADIYSVCATLYYLLCGEAPFQHDSITAVLAKAISEEPPPVREKRRDLTRSLNAVVMKGLERHRERRWQSLDDLRDALVSLLPNRQLPARPRMLIGAYLLDRIALTLLSVPAEMMRELSADEHELSVMQIRWLSILILLIYFTLGEGVFGATPGKWLLGLRVSRLGQTTPPGIVRAFIRAIVFLCLLLGLRQLFVFHDDLSSQIGAVAAGILSGFVFLASAAAILFQLNRRYGHRGLHDFLSGCHVTQKPLPRRRLRLPVQRVSLENLLLPPSDNSLPETIGGYTVRGRLKSEAKGKELWLAEDKALARSVVIVLTPGVRETPALAETSRPIRLRRLGHGSLTWSGTAYCWMAFAGPLGGPLVDSIDPNRSLNWPDARHLLEQLAEELRIVESDNTNPERLSLDQVWVEPNGRIQILDFTLTGTPPATSSLTLLREVASLALEGRPRSQSGPIFAPLPPHTLPVLDRLFTNGGYSNAAAFHHDLLATHAHRPEVTPAVRAAQLGIQAGLLAIPIAALFILALALAPYMVVMADTRTEQADTAILDISDSEKRSRFMARSDLNGPLQHTRLEARLQEFRDRKAAETKARREALLSPQRFLLEQFEENAPEHPDQAAGYTEQVTELIRWAGATDGTPRAKSLSPWRSDATPIFLLMLMIPLAMLFLATVLRGGVSMLLAGVTIVKADGLRATHRQCGLRAAIVWFPVVGLLFTSAWLQAHYLDRSAIAAALWLVAVILLAAYVVIALRFPDHPPQDRVTGTYLVPE